MVFSATSYPRTNFEILPENFARTNLTYGSVPDEVVILWNCNAYAKVDKPFEQDSMAFYNSFGLMSGNMRSKGL